MRLTVMVALLGTLAVNVAAAEEGRFFRIGTAATGGTYFTVGSVIASAISSPPGAPECGRAGACGVPGLIAVAQATQGSVENVNAIASGQLESGFVQADIAYAAWRGTGIFQQKGAVTNLRALAALFPESLHIVVPKDSPIKTLRDLKGKHVSLGEKESGTLADARLVLEMAGLKERDLQPEYLRLGQAASLVREGTLDGFFLFGGYPVPAIADLAAGTPIRLVPLPDAVIDKLHARFRFFERDEIPATAYAHGEEATPTLAVPALWLASAEVPDDVAYSIVKALWSDRTRKLLDARHPMGSRIRPEMALAGVDIPLHPGAERYYRELGMTPTPPSASQ
jgi:TRAP transporter TAXI family solute receptor